MDKSSQNPAVAGSTVQPAGRVIIPWWKQPLFLSLVLLFLTATAYSVSVKAGYTWGDHERILMVEALRKFFGVFEIWLKPGSTPVYSPMMYSTFWLENRLWGFIASASHFWNTVFHAINAVLLYRLLIRMKVPTAWVAAGFFAVTPLNVESVAWLQNRHLVLGMFFSLSSLILLLKSEPLLGGDASKQKNHKAAVISFFLSVFCNSLYAVALPLVYFLIRRDRPDYRLKPEELKKEPFLTRAYVGGGILFLIAALVPPANYFVRLTDPNFLVGTLLVPLITAAESLFPGERFFVHPGLTGLLTLSSGVGLLLVAGAAALLHRLRLPLKAILPFYLLLVYASWFNFLSDNVAGDSEIVSRESWIADSVFYAASLPVFVGIAFLFDYFARRSSRLLMTLIVWLVFAVLIMQNWNHSRKFRSVESLLVASYQQNPKSDFLRFHTAEMFLKRGDYDLASELFRAFLQDNSDNYQAHFRIGELNRLRGDYSAAIPYYEAAAKLNAEFVPAFLRLGDAYRNLGKWEDSAQSYRKSLEMKPADAHAGGELALILENTGQTTEALTLYPALIEKNGTVPIFRIRYANLLLNSGQVREAELQAREALKIDPANRQALDILSKTGS